MLSVFTGGIVNLASALALAQAEMPIISLDKVVKYSGLNFEYSSLSNIIHATKPILAKHGLTILQFPSTHESTVTVETMILHKSGEYITSHISGKLAKVDPKEIGSLISYLRRYSYASIVMCASDGDYDAEVIAERYIETPEQKKWLREVLEAMKVSDLEVMRKVSAEMKKGGFEVNENAVIQAMDKVRK